MKRKAVWISCILAALFCGCAANASVIMTLEQGGPNVVATGRGTADITGLTIAFSQFFSTSIDPQRAELTVGPGFPNAALGSFYKGISGPTFITSTRNTVASSGVGGPAGVVGEFHWLVVPFDHVSGMPLSATATFDNTTIADLGVPPGIYTWTWGSGTHEDSLKLFAGVPMPEPGTLGLLTLGAAGLALLKWRSSI